MKTIIRKESDVQWLGSIPKHWSVSKIKRHCMVKRGASPRPIDDPKYFSDDGEYSWVRISDVTASTRYLTTTEQRLSELGTSLSVKQEPGDIFVSICASVGKPIITQIKCCIHDGFVWFEQLKLNREYLFYLFTSGEMFKGLGNWGTQLNLNTDIIAEIEIPVPPPSEQRRIAAYLDEQTEKIDRLMDMRRRQMALLREQRSALIQQAVTRGLNPNVPMKDSGLPWLGEIPEHWEVKRIKYIAGVESGHTPSRSVEAYWQDCDIPWVSLNDSGYLRNNDYIEDTFYMISSLGIANSSAHILPENSVIFSRDATVGLCAISTRPMAVSQHFIAYLCSPALIPEYLLFILRSMTQELQRLSMGATISTIGMDDIRNLVTPVPPIEEQKAICSYIAKNIPLVDSAIAAYDRQLTALTEYRAALIHECVTGQRLIPEAVSL